jgi:aromatic ring-opening dioxygenase catalytic subunit (LigB family)
MGELVGVFATSHVLFPRAGVEEQAATVLRGFATIRERLAAARPDVVLVASSEHGEVFPVLGPQPAFALAVVDSFEAHGHGLPRRTYRSSESVATDLLRFTAQAGFDLAALPDPHFDHGVLIPLEMVLAPSDTIVLPLITNCGLTPACPSLARSFRLGEACARWARESGLRVAVLGSGGLSHWPGMAAMGRINTQWDRAFLAALAAGDLDRWLQQTPAEVMAGGGNGGLELNNWVFSAGAAGNHGGEVLYYEPIAPWVTGMSAMELEVGIHVSV